MLKTKFLLTLCLLFSFKAFAVELRPDSKSEALQQVITVANHYISATACDVEHAVDFKNVAIIKSWQGDYGTYEGKYLVFWNGNEFCSGGSSGFSINVTPVNVDPDYGRIYVEPEKTFVAGGSQLIFEKILSVEGNNITAEVSCGISLNIISCTSKTPLKVTFIKKEKGEFGAHWETTGKDADEFFKAQDPSQ